MVLLWDWSPHFKPARRLQGRAVGRKTPLLWAWLVVCCQSSTGLYSPVYFAGLSLGLNPGIVSPISISFWAEENTGPGVCWAGLLSWVGRRPTAWSCSHPFLLLPLRLEEISSSSDMLWQKDHPVLLWGTSRENPLNLPVPCRQCVRDRPQCQRGPLSGPGHWSQETFHLVAKIKHILKLYHRRGNKCLLSPFSLLLKVF